MKERDITALNVLLDRASLDVKTAVVYAPSANSLEFQSVIERLPRADTFTLSRTSWDLSRPYPVKGGSRIGLLVAMNVFSSSSDPKLWLQNIGRKCDKLLIQDGIRAWRKQASETDPDTGDVMRYSWSSHGEKARAAVSFDMSFLDSFVDDVVFYDDDPAYIYETHKEIVVHDCRKFAAIIRIGEWIEELDSLAKGGTKIADPNDDFFPVIGRSPKGRKK